MRDPRIDPRRGDIIRLSGGPMASHDGVEYTDILVDSVHYNHGLTYVYWFRIYEDGSRGSLVATQIIWWINDGEFLFTGTTATIIHIEPSEKE